LSSRQGDEQLGTIANDRINLNAVVQSFFATGSAVPEAAVGMAGPSNYRGATTGHKRNLNANVSFVVG